MNLTDVASVKLGDTQVMDIYMGSTQIYHVPVLTNGTFVSISGSSSGSNTCSATSNAFSAARVTKIYAVTSGNTAGDNGTLYIDVYENSVWVNIGAGSPANGGYAMTASTDKVVTQWRIRWIGGAYVNRGVSGYISQMYI